ncbi:esterase [Oscillatoriales cyanobacterium USR001]|nr:esterase [Oscillatoriales cyanobacterium USR001]
MQIKITILSLLIPWLLSIVGLLMSIWIILPAPTISLLYLAVGTPEISPWLIVINAIAILLNALIINQSRVSRLSLICSLLAMFISFLPLLQLPTANAKIAADFQRILGVDYLTKIPESTQAKFRDRAFILIDAFRGIPLKKVRIDRGIEFANYNGEKLQLNFYRPLEIGKYPTIIILYGGGWRKGNPDDNEEFSRYMAAQGYCVVAIDYRHSPKYHFPAQIEDVKTALAYLKTHANEWEIDLERIAMLGRSAGAQLATLYAYNSDLLPIRAVVNYYGPNNLTMGYNDPPFPDPLNVRSILRDFIGGTPKEFPELYDRASPANYVKPKLPASLLVYAGRDRVVQPKFGRGMYQKLQSTGNRAILLEIPWAEHAFDAVFNGVSNQLALYYTERFLAYFLLSSDVLITK